MAKKFQCYFMTIFFGKIDFSPNLNFHKSVFFISFISSEFLYLFIKNWKRLKKTTYFCQILKGSQFCLIFLNMSWINFKSLWKPLSLHKHRCPDKGKSNHWQFYVKKILSKFPGKHTIFMFPEYCNKIKYMYNTKIYFLNKLDKKSQIKQ